MLAAVLFAAALIFSALSIGRSLTEHYRDLPVLRALGLSRGAIGLVITMHAMTIAIVAAARCDGGWLWRPPLPHRSARPAEIEPDPGLDVDAALLLIGAVIIVVSLSLILLVWGMRMAGRRQDLSVEQATQPRLRESVGIIGHMRAGPSIGTALRFAFQRPTGSRTAGSARIVGCQRSARGRVVRGSARIRGEFGQRAAHPGRARMELGSRRRQHLRDDS